MNTEHLKRAECPWAGYDQSRQPTLGTFMAQLLLVEDDVDLALSIMPIIEIDGHQVKHVASISEAEQALAGRDYDLLIVDWELPDSTGVQLCRALRKKGSSTPVLILTGKAKVSDKEEGLDAGADDYLTKPFHVKELISRVSALLRRSTRPYSGSILQHQDVSVEPTKFIATRNGAPLDLLPKEFALLEFLLRNPHRTHSLEDLADCVWTASEEIAAETVRTHLLNLRKKLEAGGKPPIIENVHGSGYRLIQN